MFEIPGLSGIVHLLKDENSADLHDVTEFMEETNENDCLLRFKYRISIRLSYI